MTITRYQAPPNRWTFTIKPVQQLLHRYVGDGKGWVDPFAGLHSPAELTNDLNPDLPSAYHLLAEGTVYDEQRYAHLQPRQEEQWRRRAVKALERLGYQVVLEKVA